MQEAIRTGESQSRQGRLAEFFPGLAGDEAAGRLSGGQGDLLCLPLTTGQRTLGVLTLFTGEARQGELAARQALAEELGRRVALSVDNTHLYRRLQEEDRRKDLFLALLGHELRNPLAAMNNALEVIRLRNSGSPSIRPSLEILHRQVGHQKRLIDDLLDVSRINQGKLQLRKQPVELGALAALVADDLRPQAEDQGLELTAAGAREPLWLDADPTRLEQILSNLLFNAVKYNRPGGRIRLSWQEEQGEAVLRIRDTGVGIPAAMLPRIFDTFAQVESAVHHSAGGLGLGLSLVRSLVELHGGQIRAYSDGPGRGAEFVLRLPLLPPPAGRPADSGARQAAERGEGRLQILLADDNEDAAASLGEVLEYWGHQVRVAHGGREALGAAGARAWDAAILDIGMPDLDGYAVARELRARPDGERLFLVALTGYGQLQDVENARAAGFDTHLTKPASFEQLQAALDQVRERKLAPAEAVSRG